MQIYRILAPISYRPQNQSLNASQHSAIVFFKSGKTNLKSKCMYIVNNTIAVTSVQESMTLQIVIDFVIL